jgi:preprotein translocase subunit SecA
MGQRDPLTEWQREGFEMFGQMMQGIAQDLLRYVMHVQVEVSEPAKAQAAAAAAAAEAKAKAEAEALANAPKVPLDWSAPTAEPAGEADAEAAIEAEDAAPAEAATSEEVAESPEAAPAEAEGAEAVGAETAETAETASDTEAGAPTETGSEEAAEAGAQGEGAETAETASEPASVVSIGGGDAEVQILGYSMPEDPSSGSGMSAPRPEQGASRGSSDPDTLSPIVKSEWEKTARNAPCPCGSGKKYKRCHGSNAA